MYNDTRSLAETERIEQITPRLSPRPRTMGAFSRGCLKASPASKQPAIAAYIGWASPRRGRCWPPAGARPMQAGPRSGSDTWAFRSRRPDNKRQPMDQQSSLGWAVFPLEARSATKRNRGCMVGCAYPTVRSG